MNYLIDLGFTQEEVNHLQNNVNEDIAQMIKTFPRVIAVNYQYLNNLGISNIKEVFTNHAKMFLINPDRFKAIFAKYDQDDLIRCIEKNAAVVEKL